MVRVVRNYRFPDNYIRMTSLIDPHRLFRFLGDKVGIRWIGFGGPLFGTCVKDIFRGRTILWRIHKQAKTRKY